MKNWKIKEVEIKKANHLSEILGVNSIISQLLVLRGITTFDEAKTFFRPRLSQLHDPFLMKDMKEAVERLDRALRKDEKILIYGDYDVDGTTSVAMLYSFLNQHTKNLGYYIPDRYVEGYGLSILGIEYAKTHGYKLIITLDCGITSINEIDYGVNKDIDFIICDHHIPSEELPNAVAILNPKQFDCGYPYKDLSGCGVGFKLIQGFSQKKQIPFDMIKSFLDLLVISIAADIVPITGENRIFAFYGLQQLNQNPRTGIKSLMKLVTRRGTLKIEDILFGIAPRINAAGRIKHGKQVVRLLIESDLNEANILAKEIELLNIERRQLDQRISKEALNMVDKNKSSNVLYSPYWHTGVAGIVASRVIEKNYKPTIILVEKDGKLTGSARSVKGFNIYNALKSCEGLLEKFGGHKYAAGLTIKKKHLDKFIDLFEQTVIETIKKDQLIPEIVIDMELRLQDIDNKLLRLLEQFEPFGPGNAIPIFMTRRVHDIGEGKQVGLEGKHLKLNILSKNVKKPINAIGFNLGPYFMDIRHKKIFDICYSIDQNEWNGTTSTQLKLHDIVLSL